MIVLVETKTPDKDIQPVLAAAGVAGARVVAADPPTSGPHPLGAFVRIFVPTDDVRDPGLAKLVATLKASPLVKSVTIEPDLAEPPPLRPVRG